MGYFFYLSELTPIDKVLSFSDQLMAPAEIEKPLGEGEGLNPGPLVLRGKTNHKTMAPHATKPIYKHKSTTLRAIARAAMV